MPRSIRRPRATIVLGAVAAICLLCNASVGVPDAFSATAQSGESAPAPGAAVPVGLTFTLQGAGRPIPSRFLGLSFEAAALSQLGSYARRGDLVELLRSLGPGILRFGGITSDENVGWSDSATPPPPWASSVIDPSDLRAIGVLARRSGWRVLLTVGLAHYEPLAAAREVAAAHAALGSHLAAVEIGNEPEAYANHGYRSQPWVPQAYEEEISDYREAIDALTPGVPIAGPDSSGSGSFLEWGFAEALAQVPVMLTGHHYPLGCAQTPPPSIETLLSAATRGRESRSLETYMSIARANNIPLRIDEAGTVSCGGVPGISDTFASSLWAAGYIAQTMAAGAAGINLEGNPNNCLGYTPICAPDAADAAAGRLKAEPDFYGLLLTRSLIGYRPLPTTITAQGSPDLAATAFAGPRGSFKLLLSDDEPAGSPALALRIPVGPGLGPARLLTLTGPGQSATSGILLAGRAVPPSGAWPEPRAPHTVLTRGGLLSLSLPASTAVLVTLNRAPRKTHQAVKRHHN